MKNNRSGMPSLTRSLLLGVLICSCFWLFLSSSTLVIVRAGSPNNNNDPGSSTLAAAVPASAATAASAPSPAAAVGVPQTVGAEEFEDQCVGVFLQYEALGKPERIWPYVTHSRQPYRFRSEVSVTNTGFEPVTEWELSVDFQWSEIIAEAPGVLFLTAGLAPPGLAVGNDTRIVGVEKPDLMTSIDTAENVDLISANFTILGTEFGVDENGVPLPKSMSLVNAGYNCSAPSYNGNGPASNNMWVCCTENATAINSTSRDSGFLPRETGDLTMTYDVMGAYQGYYWAQVSMSMDNPLGRIDHWNLTWEWRQGEFIQAMKGGQILGASEQDKCVFGSAAKQYSDGSVVFENVMSCSPNPVMIDLTPDSIDDPSVAIPHCCRNGTLLPHLVDPAQSKANFQVQVRKISPHMAPDDFSPPLNWNIADGYECTQPRRVSPSEFSPEALHSASAVASWQVVCNLTQEPAKKCCVSFSSFFNHSLIPCPTCSCGCPHNQLPWNGETCNPNIEPMLLPYNAALLPPSNRTTLGIHLARLDHRQIPQPTPCPDNCGVNINWHVYSDYRDSWSARITLLNWDDTPIPKWFSAIEMPVAMAGLQSVNSFNVSKVPGVNNTLFMQGHNGYYNDYLLGKDPTDNPGKLQSLLSFSKRRTPGIQVVQGDGYPTKVWFNGEECALPNMFPGGGGWRFVPSFPLMLLLSASIFLLASDSMSIL